MLYLNIFCTLKENKQIYDFPIINNCQLINIYLMSRNIIKICSYYI